MLEKNNWKYLKKIFRQFFQQILRKIKLSKGHNSRSMDGNSFLSKDASLFYRTIKRRMNGVPTLSYPMIGAHKVVKYLSTWLN